MKSVGGLSEFLTILINAQIKQPYCFFFWFLPLDFTTATDLYCAHWRLLLVRLCELLAQVLMNSCALPGFVISSETVLTNTQTLADRPGSRSQARRVDVGMWSVATILGGVLLFGTIVSKLEKKKKSCRKYRRPFCLKRFQHAETRAQTRGPLDLQFNVLPTELFRLVVIPVTCYLSRGGRPAHFDVPGRIWELDSRPWAMNKKPRKNFRYASEANPNRDSETSKKQNASWPVRN